MKKKSEDKPKFKPVGKFLSVTTVKSVQKTTEHGIVYEDKATGRYVVSTVVDVGDGVEEDIKPGDTVYWDSKQFKGDEVEGMHIINESWVAVVERE
jgi:co-chaperonin GroES (HSP10)